MADLVSTSKSYQELLTRLKNQIGTAQVQAALAVNRELVLLYWSIGRETLGRQATEGWGTKVIERLAKGSAYRIPRDERALPDESPVYARFCRGVAGRTNSPTSCWANFSTTGRADTTREKSGIRLAGFAP